MLAAGLSTDSMQRDDAGRVPQANVKGDCIMLRRLLLPMLATAALAGCATDYQYRNGNGDYYYGQPRVEYRYQGPGGYYGGYGFEYGYGGYGATYFYDRLGRLVYGYPGSYYGSPYYGGNGWYRPRPHQGHGDRNDHDDDAGNNHERPPPWRDLGRLQQRNQDENQNRYRDRDENGEARQPPIPRQESFSDETPRQQRPAPPASMNRERSESSSRMGGFIRGAVRPQGKHNAPPEE